MAAAAESVAPELEPVVEPAVELAGEPIVAMAPGPIAERMPEPIFEIEDEPVVTIEREAATELAGEPGEGEAIEAGAAPPADAGREPAAEPGDALVAEPVAERRPEWSGESVTEPSDGFDAAATDWDNETVAEHVESADESVIASASESTAGPAPEPIEHLTAETAVEVGPEPSGELTLKPPETAEPDAELSAEPIEQWGGESAAEPVEAWETASTGEEITDWAYEPTAVSDETAPAIEGETPVEAPVEVGPGSETVVAATPGVDDVVVTGEADASRDDTVLDVAHRLESLADALRRIGPAAVREGLTSDDSLEALLTAFIAGYMAGRRR